MDSSIMICCCISADRSVHRPCTRQITHIHIQKEKYCGDEVTINLHERSACYCYLHASQGCVRRHKRCDFWAMQYLSDEVHDGPDRRHAAGERGGHTCRHIQQQRGHEQRLFVTAFISTLPKHTHTRDFTHLRRPVGPLEGLQHRPGQALASAGPSCSLPPLLHHPRLSWDPKFGRGGP